MRPGQPYGLPQVFRTGGEARDGQAKAACSAKACPPLFINAHLFAIAVRDHTALLLAGCGTLSRSDRKPLSVKGPFSCNALPFLPSARCVPGWLPAGIPPQNKPPLAQLQGLSAQHLLMAILSPVLLSASRPMLSFARKTRTAANAARALHLLKSLCKPLHPTGLGAAVLHFQLRPRGRADV